ncbi:hypothetical protein D9M70_584290 [compost metagenome]
MVDRVDQHRQADHVGQQDELLAYQSVAFLPGLGEEADSLEPFGLGQLHLAGESVQVTHQALHQLAYAGIGRIGEGGDGLGGDLRFGSYGHCCFLHMYIAPTLLRGNASRDAPASSDAERHQPGSHAGAWEP